MKYTKTAISLIILFGSVFNVSSQIQPRFKSSSGYLRSSIEKLPEKENRSLLKYLDDGRAAADQGIQLLTSGKYDEFYETASESFKKLYSAEQFRQLIEAFETSTGKILLYEYRAQALELPKNEVLSANLSKATSNTYYDVWLSKAFGKKFFMDVETTIENGEHKISFVTTTNYDKENPPWLNKTDVSNKQAESKERKPDK